MPKIQLSSRQPNGVVSPNSGSVGRSEGIPNTGFTSHVTPSTEGGNGVYNLRSMVTQSAAYKNAYNIFSADTRYGASYLARLQQISSIAIESDKTIWDKLNLSNKSEDKDFATYQMCIEQINNLVAEYYQFINSLPSSQVQQQLDAGVYGIMSGDSVSQSEMNPQKGSINSANMESTNPLENLLSLGNFALSFCTTGLSAITSAWSAIQNVRLQNQNLDLSKEQFGLSKEQFNLSKEQFDLDKKRYNLNENQFLSSLWTALDSHGYNMPSNVFNSYDDFLAWVQTQSVHDPHAQDKRSKSSRSATLAGIYDMALEPFRQRDPLSIRSFGGDFARLYNDIGNFQIEQAYNLLKYQKLQAQNDAKYQQGLSVDDKLAADNAAFNMQLQHNKFISLINENKVKFFEEQLQKVEKSYDPISKFAVSQMLFNDPWLSSFFAFGELNNGLRGESGSMASYLNPLNGGLVGLGLNVLPELLRDK